MGKKERNQQREIPRELFCKWCGLKGIILEEKRKARREMEWNYA